MRKPIRWEWAFVLFLCATTTSCAARPQATNTPLDATKLLAVVAGNALPENIAAAIEQHGLTFKPSVEYQALLKDAGATPEVLKAISKASIHAETEAENTKHLAEILAHLATAGKLLRNKKSLEAQKEINAGMEAGGRKLEMGFVMGEALRQREEWMLAVAVYTEIVREDENFPEANTKLSYMLYRAGDQEDSLRAAKAALGATPNNAEAHKNAGLALESMQKYDAAVAEYREALRIKPDYESVHYDLGLLLYDKNDFDASVAEYKKALTLSPRDIAARINLALSYEKKNDGDSAIRELREAKRLDPNSVQVRQSLGSILINHNRDTDAVVELRQLEAMAPESEVCHVCLATALYKLADFEGAKKEDLIAIRLDPSDPMARRELGRTYEAENKYELALKEYRKVEEMDPENYDSHLCVARVLLQTKQAKLAAEELKSARELAPGNAHVHEQYGKALEALGELEQAKSEYKEALLLDGGNEFVILDLAQLLEKEGDWPDAMDHYRTASRKVTTDVGAIRGLQMHVNAPGEYKAAQLRLNEHLSQLRATGKSSEADALETKIERMRAGEGISDKLDAAMEAGLELFRQNRFVESEGQYKEAVKLAEQIQPHEGRLVMSLSFLGGLYLTRKDYVDAQAAFERSLKLGEEVFGTGATQLSQPLEGLARAALEQGDMAKAELFAQRHLALDEKNYGKESVNSSMSLMIVGYVYYTGKQYEKAEAYLERAVKIHEQLPGPEAAQVLGSRGMLCSTYDLLKQPAKSEPCDRQLLVEMNKYYGGNSPALAPVLTREAKALRTLGRATEADEVEKRLHSLQQAIAGTN